jgi:trk system potassium uptake protein TrkA
MKVAITGGGEVAFQIARELDETLDILVIEQDPETAARFDQLDVQVVRGNPIDIRTLRSLEMEKGDHFIACGESDEQNIIACLAAKQACGLRTTCFLSGEDYYHSFVRDHEEHRSLDIDRLISPPYLLADEIARIVLAPHAIDVHTFLGGRIWLQEYRIRAKSKLVGRPVADLGLPPGIVAVTVARDEDLVVPRGATKFEPDDRVAFMGAAGALRTLEKRFFRDVVEKVSFVTIVGGGEVGLAVARRLEEEADLELLKLIEPSLERCEYLASTLEKTMVLQGDGTDLELLELEQIYRSDVLVSVTSDDETNLLCSLIGRETEIPKIITRVSQPANLYLFESVGIDVPLNPRATAIKSVLHSLQDTRNPLLGTVASGRGNVLEVDVPADFEPTYIRDMPAIKETIVAAIVRDYMTLVPHGGNMIQPGDRLLVFCTDAAAETVRDYF